jgi:hypothetical protein
MAMKEQTSMSKVRRLFKPGFSLRSVGAILAMGCFLALPVQAAPESTSFKKNETGLYRDIFDQNMYYEGTSYLRLERLYQRLFGKKVRAANVNLFDEVPDSIFFTNRHARQKLSQEELERGYRENDGPDLSGNLEIVNGKFEGLHPGFFVKDARGNEYLLKFDAVDNFELATSAEIIGGRFYYAIGYNVPQETIVVFPPEKLVPGPDAKIYDDTGFKKKLTPERLEEYLLFLPQDSEGRFRASASKILAGKNKGSFSFHGRRKEDLRDPLNHRDRREIRALRVFSSWLNNNDVRESNTLDMLVTENGEEVLKHYLIDFNSSLGAAAKGAKPPMFSHEYILDYGEALKAFVSLGIWEKPWQKRWQEAGEKVTQAPAVGYFDNRYFDPGKYKTQLPYYAFKDLTRADGFWAAKIIMSFSDDDIRAMVKPGQLSDPKDAEEISRMLIERRNLIGRYWFEKANPLDAFDLAGNRLTFKDLAVESGFNPAGDASYLIDVIGKEGKRGKKITSLESREPAVSIDPTWWSQNAELDLLIRTVRKTSSKPSPYVLVELSPQRVEGIIHQD